MNFTEKLPPLRILMDITELLAHSSQYSNTDKLEFLHGVTTGYDYKNTLCQVYS